MKIEVILSHEEGKTLEFKENLQSLKNIIKTAVAFSNTAGGMIVIGVEDKTKKIIGVSNPLLEEERLANAISASVCPLLAPDIEIHTYRNKELIVINIPHSAGPYYVKSDGPEKGVYIRFGSTNRVVDDEMLQTLRNFAKNKYFDETPFIGGKVSDLDWDAINDSFNQVHKKVTMPIAESLGLVIKNGNAELPSYGGILLFGKNRLKIFPEAIIRCARFLGNTRIDFLDTADFKDYLPSAMKDALKFIQRNTSMKSTIKALKREDIPQYPLIALREVILNAIVHSDYAAKGIYITIAIFDERIEITNPGALPLGLTLEKALAGSSRIRNRVIAKVFHHLKLIEQWGTGLQRVIEACRQYGLEKPHFEEMGNQFRVTLYATKQPIIELLDWQKALVTFLKKKEKISTKEAASLWKVTTRTARSRLIELTNLGIVIRRGTSQKDPKSVYVLAQATIADVHI